MASRSGEAPDDELVRRYVAGDAAAFTILVSRHERRVYNLAYRMLGREEDARDATQDAFLTALRRLQRAADVVGQQLVRVCAGVARIHFRGHGDILPSDGSWLPDRSPPISRPSAALPRCRRDFTVPTGMPRMSAISS